MSERSVFLILSLWGIGRNMGKHSLKLLFLRKYRTSKKYYRQLRLPSAIDGETLSIGIGTKANSSAVGNGHQAHGGGSGGGGGGRRRPTGYVNNSAPVDTVDCCVLLYDLLSHCRLRTFLVITVIGIISTAGLYFHNQSLLQYRLNNTNTSSTYDNDSSSSSSSTASIKINSTTITASSAALLLINYAHHNVSISNSQLFDNENMPYLNRVYREDVFSPKHGIRLKRCTIPILKPLSPEVKPFIGYSNKPNCVHEQRNSFNDEIPFSIQNASWLVRNPKVDPSHTRGCCYRPFHRNGENNIWSSNYCKEITQEITQIPEDVEYFELLCSKSGAETDFKDGFALTPRKTQTESRIANFEDEFGTSSTFSLTDNLQRLSVLILGLDATSHMNFIRAMPKSNKYLLNTMKAISLNGYTKVAENTLPNVVPLLTGHTLDEFRKMCVDESQGIASTHLDDCPFIWKTFGANGYRTSLAEDDVDIGIFNMNWGNAFVNSPTDYYLRPFSHLMQKSHSYKNGYCYGSSLSFEKLLEYVKSMAQVFNGQTYFQFMWSTKLSHDDFNKMRWGDDSLVKLLEYLNTGNYLNNTALLILGDHGSRLDKIRSTAQGKLEDRMPVAYIALPLWFRIKYHRAYRNLRKNSDRVTSAFDMHKTFYDFLNLDNLLNRKNEPVEKDDDTVVLLPNQKKVDLSKYRGLSLFTEVPENRTCFAAGIPLHWCICHRKIAIKKDSEVVEQAAEFVVASLNTLMRDVRVCSELLLQSVDEVSKWDSSEIIREGCHFHHEQTGNGSSLSVAAIGNKNTTTTASSPPHLSSSSSSCKNDSEVLVLQIAFTTTPGDATFETTVIQLSDGRWRLTEDVVRTNSYEGQSDCVEQKLKPYCYCIDDEGFFGGLFRKR